VNAKDIELLDKHVQSRFPGLEKSRSPAGKYIILFLPLFCGSVHFQMKVSRFLALDAFKRAIRGLLGGQTIFGHMNCELAIIVHKHSNTLDRFAPWP
jgi:hypothetical protein